MIATLKRAFQHHEAIHAPRCRPPPWLRVGDLQIWLAQRVKELSNGAQSPMTLLPFREFTNWTVYQVATSAK
jgi:hypothetical protein